MGSQTKVISLIQQLIIFFFVLFVINHQLTQHSNSECHQITNQHGNFHLNKDHQLQQRLSIKYSNKDHESNTCPDDHQFQHGQRCETCLNQPLNQCPSHNFNIQHQDHHVLMLIQHEHQHLKMSKQHLNKDPDHHSIIQIQNKHSDHHSMIQNQILINLYDLQQILIFSYDKFNGYKHKFDYLQIKLNQMYFKWYNITYYIHKNDFEYTIIISMIYLIHRW